MPIIGETTFAAIGLLFLIAAIRTFTSTLYMTLFGAVPNETAGAIALGVFAASILAAVAAWRLGPRGSIALSGTLLAGSTIAATASRSGWADIALAAVAVIAGTWWLGLTHSARSGAGGSAFVLGLPLALALDLAIRAATGTIPLTDLATPVALALVVAGALIFFAAGLASFGIEREWTSPGLRGSVALFAIPALILLSELAAANPGQAAGSAGLSRGPESAGSWFAIAASLGLGMVLGAIALWRPVPSRRVVAAVAVAAGAGLIVLRLPIAASAGGILLAGGVFVAAATLADTSSRPSRSPVVGVLALSVGWIVFVALAFAFYAYYATPLPLWVAVVVVIAGLLATRPAPQPRFGLAGAALIALLTIVAPLAALAGTPPAAIVDARPAFRLMTYNIHQGFDLANVPALDSIGDTIASESPDVVVLQEAVRGWMIGVQQDTVTVLAKRLGMRYVFGPTIGDVYGNAVLSKFPISDVRYLSYAREPLLRHQPRGAILFRVAEVLVIATHLDHIAGATDVRQRQVREILAAWGSARPAVVAGDLNAQPGTAELRLLEDAGFRDLVRDDGADQPTFPADKPAERIDHIWGTGVSGSQAHTVASTASDHRPVVINITRQP